MAILAGAQAGKPPYPIAGANAVAPLRLGSSVFIVTPTASTAATLPIDPQSNPYAAYRITASGNIQWAFTNGSGTAVAGTANQYIASPGLIQDVIAPVGATQIVAIFDAASTAGSLCITGLY